MTELLSVSRAPGRPPVLCVGGEIDVAAVAPLRRAVDRAVTPGDRGLVLDLADVTYLDSAGIHLLVQVAEDLAAHRQSLRLVVPAASALRPLMAIAGLTDVVVIDPDLGAARRALDGRS